MTRNDLANVRVRRILVHCVRLAILAWNLSYLIRTQAETIQDFAMQTDALNQLDSLRSDKTVLSGSIPAILNRLIKFGHRVIVIDSANQRSRLRDAVVACQRQA